VSSDEHSGVVETKVVKDSIAGGRGFPCGHKEGIGPEASVLDSKVFGDAQTCTARHNDKQGNTCKVSYAQFPAVGGDPRRWENLHQCGEVEEAGNMPQLR